ncbi:hypothetical protein FF011L_26000 [Roseimaritima multifibrata]|uniref:DUF6250 domain-containing protein n=1 Tax=Roseimaritima multifibrata TaxID=1930274 RepID=A0A517MGD7_9BACT|nr:right-handed parallel beta-helix repeat-containing protein [Roseimaritima multifibrata]QDS93827.1 hypothetical protein FF011L_26000 [Roseimaritima multifibrata]
MNWKWLLLVGLALPLSGKWCAAGEPIVVGRGVDLFEIGSLIAEDDFATLDDWEVQIQQRDGFPPAQVVARDNSLDCLLPGRGCTVWFKRNLPTRITISYDVICPTPHPAIKGVQPRDINNFWMATDPADPRAGLFDADRYSGKFSSYDKIHGYYASTGGGGAVANRTTRMRRYPRSVDDKPIDHLALTSKDEQPGYLITPDKVMSVQLVAYDDVVQYIVDEKLVYEIARGDSIQLEGRDPEGKPTNPKAVYDLDRFPAYEQGFFGFRMVGTHHIYTNFRVHALEPANEQASKASNDTALASTVQVASIEALREAMAKSNQRVVMKPGSYVVSDLADRKTAFYLSGSNNHFDLSGVTLLMPLSTLRKMTSSGPHGRAAYKITGDHITLKGGTFENQYPDGMTEVTDFGSYNQTSRYHPSGSMTEVSISGDDAKILDCRFTIRGSFPYGYGNMYGIGAGSAVRLKKHSGIQISGDRALIDRCKIQMESFGHAIFVQGGDDLMVRNTQVEGKVRRSDDLYLETEEGDLAKKFNYELQWPKEVKGLPIPKAHMLNLTEDGIRAYSGSGHVTVENCQVRKSRGGIKLYMAKSATVKNCEVQDCIVQGYSLPSRGVVENSRGNAAYGPLLYIHSDSHTSQQIELTVQPAPHGLGDHVLAAIRGRNHTINLASPDDAIADTPRPIVVGYPLRFDFLCVDYPRVPAGYESHFSRFAPKSYRASGITLRNSTHNPVVLGTLSEDNTIISTGPIRDLGTNNRCSPPQ